MRSLFLVTIFASLFLGACNVNKRDPKTPVQTIKKVKTDFFFEFSPDRTTYKSKRFLFGMSSEDKAGRFRDLNMDHYNLFGSSNVEFEFDEEGTKLVGRLVNPTYPNNKAKWQVLLTFKVSRNYYDEKRVDGTGRTSNDRIERTDKSDPRARPFIDLDISSMQFQNNVRIGPYSSLAERVIQKIEDVEWSDDGDFLGFTTISTNKALGSNAQTVDRVNLLRMEKTPADFEITQYNKENDRHTQILHILSSLPNHYGENLKAVHWDINEKTKKKHTIYLHNFPDDYLKVAKDSVESWNDAFEGIVGYRPFLTEVWESKYHFDLRRHVIHWVDDIRLSAAGPLGVANVAADVETGRVLWTGSIIWGGILDRYAGRNVPSMDVTGAAATWSRPHDLSLLISRKNQAWSSPLTQPEGESYSSDFTNYLSMSMKADNDSYIQSMIKEHHDAIDQQVKSEEIDTDQANSLKLAFEARVRSQSHLDSANQLLLQTNQALGMTSVNDVDLDEAYFGLKENPITLDQVIQEVGLKTNSEGESTPLYLGMLDPESDTFKNLPASMRQGVASAPAGFYEYTHDLENSALEAINTLNAGIEQLVAAGEIVDIEQVKRGMIRNTVVHEIGHTLGLGHNFKSNIMPEKGSVPNAIYEDLHAKATAPRTDAGSSLIKEKMTNTSSIMGYPDGLTEALKSYEEHSPGYNDISRLRYLYKQEYPMYDKSSDGKSDYVWFKLGDDGRILPQKTVNGKKLTPGYLPNCNDIEASFYADPYCARHDRGYNARTLMISSFERYRDSLAQSLESSIDSLKSRDYGRIEGYLWYRTSKVMSRGRLFHDYMRNKYRKEIKALNGETFETYNNLLNFSQNCRDLEAASDEELSELADNKNYARFIEKRSDGKEQINEFGDLCIASSIYFDQIHELLQLEGKEYTELDYFNRLAPGGIRTGDSRTDYSQFWGSWKRISLLPIKIKAMQNVLLPFATMNLGGREVPIYTYARPDTSFSTATLYPKEYLKIVRTLVKSAMSIHDQTSEPSISQSLLYLGYFMRFQSQTRDYKIFPSEILDSVSSQTRFRFSNALIEIEATKEDGSQYAKTFKGSIYNRYNSSGKETLGSVYLYSFDRIVMSAQNNSLALQVSPIRWRSPSNGISFAIKLDYAPNFNFEELEAYSPRKYFIDNYFNTLQKCVKGDNAAQDNGLESYFNNNHSEYEGILVPFNIDTRSSAYKEVNDSIIFNLNKFSRTKDFDLRSCENALKTQKTLVLGAALMMGFVFPETLKYFEKGAY